MSTTDCPALAEIGRAGPCEPRRDPNGTTMCTYCRRTMSTPPVPTVSEAPHDALDVIAAWRCVADLAEMATLRLNQCVNDELEAERRWQIKARKIIAAHVEATAHVPTVSAMPEIAQHIANVLHFAETFVSDWESDDGMDAESRKECEAARKQLDEAEAALMGLTR